MNKKIYKGYELAEAVDNGILDLEQRVNSFNDMEYYNCTIDFILRDNAKNVMFKEFELLEDNTEEIEEIPQYRIDNCTDYNYCYLAEKYNKLAKAVNQIRKDLNK